MSNVAHNVDMPKSWGAWPLVPLATLTPQYWCLDVLLAWVSRLESLIVTWAGSLW